MKKLALVVLLLSFAMSVFGAIGIMLVMVVLKFYPYGEDRSECDTKRDIYKEAAKRLICKFKKLASFDYIIKRI
ncbi:hypothetical protein KDD93_08225 [Campylobacter sp. faydin G-24]|uniref:Uncharacterized protein n=1 Tax=Campylobacter anatolicus TaxID=2829105 RepID=A0ABS5HK82_9BACT|nr:hypothetical protein [Campylobacter anatolicus]MBR8464548.1 hypothetical protein [Campylobacter anatolicus]